MSSSPSGSWMMQGTTGSTSEFGVILLTEANVKEVKADGDTGAEASTFLAALAVGFFLANEQMVEVAVRRFPLGACLSVPSYLFFSL